MKQDKTLLFILIVLSFVVAQPAFAQERDFQDISQKIEKFSHGLAGHTGVAAQEIGSGGACHSKRR